MTGASTTGPSTWADDEPDWGTTLKGVASRLLQRSRRTWRVWAGILCVLSVVAAIQKVRSPTIEPAEVVIRMVEGRQPELSGTPMSTRLLRARIFDLAFARPKILEIVRQHRAAFPRLSLDPVVAVDDLLSGVSVIISENDFVEYRTLKDPPRSVKISVQYKAQDPHLALAIARDLAELVVKTEVEEQRKDVESQATISSETENLGADALKGLLTDRTQLVDKSRSTNNGPARPSGLLSSARGRIGQAQKEGAGSQLLLRAVDENLALHLELVDPGRPPVRKRWLAPAVGVLMGLPLFLLVTALVVGAFDPRVLDEEDLKGTGISALGHARARWRV